MNGAVTRTSWITPEVADIGWDSFLSASELIELGEQAALAALPAIQRWLPAPARDARPVPHSLPAVSAPHDDRSAAPENSQEWLCYPPIIEGEDNGPNENNRNPS